jgi:hypothetical protein
VNLCQSRRPAFTYRKLCLFYFVSPLPLRAYPLGGSTPAVIAKPRPLKPKSVIFSPLTPPAAGGQRRMLAAEL